MAAESSLDLFYPEDPRSTSKATWVLDALYQSHPGSKKHHHVVDPQGTGVVWGLGQYYHPMVKSWTVKGKPFIFTDMPYWNRWMGDNRNSCHWRIIPNAVHCNWVIPRPDDRFSKLDIDVKDWRSSGDHILICPSSHALSLFFDQHIWTQRTIDMVRKYSKRPIKIRHKPRKGKLSGPRVEATPFEEDAKGAWAVVTMCSLTGVEAATMGIPVFCHPASPCAPIGTIDLSEIENPRMPDRGAWLNNLAYYQYTEDELREGTHRQILI